MNRLFLCTFLFCLSSTAFSLRVQNLCQNDTFAYKGFSVNSAYKMKFNTSFGTVGDYCMDEKLDFKEFFANETDAEKLESLKDSYNDQIIRIFSEEYLNSGRYDKVHLEITSLLSIKSQILELRDKAIDQSHMGRINQLTYLFDTTINLINRLKLYGNSTLKPNIQDLETFKSLLLRLEINERNETFVFKNDLPSRIYKQQLLKKEKFYFIPYSEKYYDMRSSGLLEYSITLPFQNNTYKPEKECIRLSELPLFFRNKKNNEIEFI